jgi:hypothetical protein
MADVKNQLGADGPTSVSALGLRWAALRGMLASPLIEADEQRSLRDDLLRELQTIEREFADLTSRNPVEISAKVDVVRTALRQNGLDPDGWLAGLLESVQSDIRSLGPSLAPRTERSTVNFSRSSPTRVDSSFQASDTELPATG